jgi:MFS family permease
LGLAIAAISSIIPAFSNSFTLIMVSRAVLGIGIGLANPLAISLIGVFFYGDQRATLMGWRSAIAGVGTAIMTYVAGQLLNINWHAAYWVYLLFIPTLLLFVFFVPDPQKSGALKRQAEHQAALEADATANGVTIKKNPIWLIVILTALTFLVLIAIMVLAVKLPTFFVENKIGTATQASTAWSIYNFASVIGGFLFGITYKLTHKFILPLGLFLLGLGVIALSHATSVTVIYGLCIFMGIVGAMIIPFIFNRISEVATPQMAPLFTSIALVGSNLGSFISPYAGEIMGSTGKAAITSAGGLLLGLAILSVLVIFATKAKHSSHVTTPDL